MTAAIVFYAILSELSVDDEGNVVAGVGKGGPEEPYDSELFCAEFSDQACVNIVLR